MALEWYEWECPHCRRYGQVNPNKEYEDTRTLHVEAYMTASELLQLVGKLVANGQRA